MAPNRSWMELNDRTDPMYIEGVETFLRFAFDHVSPYERQIKCPCVRCRNVLYGDRKEVHYHLLRHGILANYTTWYLHGQLLEEDETPTLEQHNDMGVNDDMIGLIHDLGAGFPNTVNEGVDHGNEIPVGESAQFYKFLDDAKQKLYPGCEHSKLGVIVKLLHLKSFHRWTNRSFDALLELLREIIPDGKQNLPTNFYNAHKYISELGLQYEKYDVCENNCVVYWNINADAQSCPICGMSRWKVANRSDGGSCIPHKVLRYFPIKQRLQRLFTSPTTAVDMTWHKTQRVDDGVMRHPADTMAWKSFDACYPDFANDSRNVRLGLATDGFQPFGNMTSQHSIWPIVLMPLNFPPWKCLKQPYIIMSLLIPGPYSPGMGIDVFLEPLMKELKELWVDGFETYDAHAKQNFIMRAAVLWTINDFPAYGDISGWSTKGYMACPSCHKDTTSSRLHGSRKICYMGHRRFLPMSHKWRKAANSFDGTIETRGRPKPLSGKEVLSEVESIVQAPFGRGVKRKYDSYNSFKNWRKKSIFFQLPYWEMLLIRHNLDVMHVEKNVCENVVGTIMNVKGKTKDTLGSRYDLVNMGIRPELHPKENGDVVEMSVARYTLSNEEKIALCVMLKELKTPDSFVSNISRCVNDKEHKLSGMKSHDCHIFLQCLLPMAIRGFLPSDVCEPLVELSAFFRDICRKSLKMDDLDRMQESVILTLCKMETIFPPSFFDIMVHLVVHLAEEARIAGPVQYRWMYPIERYLRTLKSYVRNKARPEGSIAEAYIVDECLTFCSRYLDGVDTKFNRSHRYGDIERNVENPCFGIFSTVGSTLGNGKYLDVDGDLLSKGHLYVLNNCSEVAPYVEMFRQMLPRMSQAHFVKRYNTEFSSWFKNHVLELNMQNPITDTILSLAVGPSLTCKQYHGFDVNGYRFRTSARDQSRRTQNNGILCRGDDNNIDKEYYGILDEIWELRYPGANIIHLFRCQWFDVHNRSLGCRVDQYGITTINLNRRLSTDEPFILASQAEQVFYVKDPKHVGWAVVMKTQPRDLFAMPRSVNSEREDSLLPSNDDAYQEEEHDVYGRLLRPLDEGDENVILNRDDIEPEVEAIEVANTVKHYMEKSLSTEDDFIEDNANGEDMVDTSGEESEYETSSSEEE